MKNQPAKIKLLGQALSRLTEFVPVTKDELNDWYEKATRLEADHLKGGEDYLDVPHFLWHYLADADIRMKDEEYAEMQNRRIDLVLQHLNRGEMPSDQDTDL